jgi:hypothetical protein
MRQGNKENTNDSSRVLALASMKVSAVSLASSWQHLQVTTALGRSRSRATAVEDRDRRGRSTEEHGSILHRIIKPLCFLWSRFDFAQCKDSEQSGEDEEESNERKKKESMEKKETEMRKGNKGKIQHNIRTTFQLPG